MRAARRCALATAAVAIAVATPTAAGATLPRVLVLLAPTHSASALLEQTRSDPQLDSTGLLTASVGAYNEEQTLLDVTQGARVPRGDYSPVVPAALTVSKLGVIRGWRVAVGRAASADASIEPGLLASRVPGGAAYAAAGRRPSIDAVLAADRRGRVAAVSLGSAASLHGRVIALLERYRLVVVDLPDAGKGLRALLARRPAGELVVVLERPPASARSATGSPVILGVVADGISNRHASLTTATTRTDGLVSATDLGPTILRRLGIREPAQFTGLPIGLAPALSVASLRSLAQRLGVIAGRRDVVLVAFLALWLALVGGAVAAGRGLRPALRIGGLAAFWTPSTMLGAAALRPSWVLEATLVAGGAFALAAATDRAVGWPRGAAIPIGVMLVLYTVDLARGSPLIATSLIGPNPGAGARFFGIGNELAAVLGVLPLAGAAALLPQRRLTAREIALVAAYGTLVTLVVAWGKLGANVGGIVTVGGATAVATLMLAGRFTAPRVALAAVALVGGLAVVSLLDLSFGGGAHYTRAVLHAHSLSALLSTLGRRLTEAWDALFTGEVLVAVIVCLAAIGLGRHQRAKILAAAGAADGWRAALGGGLGGALMGSIANDSGPRILLVGTFALGCVIAYLWGGEAVAAPSDERLVHTFLSDA